jgi:hypothetical protein
LDPTDLDKMLSIALHTYRTRLFIVTTPNAEYNINFPNLYYGTERSRYRHHDHRFEWTRIEFENWCRQAADKYGYQVEFHGIGRMKNPIVENDVGSCTQACVFSLLDPAPSNNTALDIKLRPHELFKHIAFPWYNAPDKQEHETIQELNEIISKLTTISCMSPNYTPPAQTDWCETWSWDQLSEDSNIPPTTEQVMVMRVKTDLTLEELWSVLRVRQLCRTRERLRELMIKTDNF